jgi:hypothetical protein
MRRGVGLVEVVLAAVVLATALAAVFGGLGVGMRGAEQIGEELTGVQLASDLLDAICAQHPRPAVTRGQVPPAAVLAGPLPVRVPEGYVAWAMVDSLPDTGDGIAAGKLRRVTVGVQWERGRRGVKLARLLCDEAGFER